MSLLPAVTALALLAQLFAGGAALRLGRQEQVRIPGLLLFALALLLALRSALVLGLAPGATSPPSGLWPETLVLAASLFLAAGSGALQTFVSAAQGHPGALYRKIVEASREGICIVDERGRVTFANRRLADLLGLSPRDLPGRSLVSLATPATRPAAEALLDRRREATEETVDLCFQSRQGGVVCTLASHAPVFDEQQRYVGALLMVTDFNHRRRVEDALRRSEQFVRATVDALAQRVAILDERGAIIAVNRCWREEGPHCPLAACPGEGDNYLAFLDGAEGEGREVAEAFAAGIRAVLDGRLTEFSLEYPVADGPERRWYLGRANPFLSGGRRQTVLTHDDITSLKLAETALVAQAHHDPLTGLPNRLLLEDRLAQHLVQAGRDRQPVAVLFLDLDRFKLINDTLGHHAGDEMLKVAASRLLGCVRKSDTVARVGGDEFVVVLTGLEDPEDATLIARKILAALTRPVDIQGREVFTSTSLGIALFPADGRDAGTLIGRADMAMYLAKEEGRNTYRFFSRELDERVQRRLRQETELRLALEREELDLHFQDQVALPEGSLCGVEALVRWRHPERGLLPASDFLPLAEETGLVRYIDTWVLGMACEKARRWRERGLPVVTLAVNLSRRLFFDPDLAGQVRETLERSGWPAGQLELEIAEDVLQENPEQAVATVGRLHALGVGIAIDNFGTGFSSLELIRQLGIRRLKINHAYIADLWGGASHFILVRTIVGMARSLGVGVVAEGVTTAEQRRLLTEWGCDVIQGFHLHKPAAEKEWLALLGEVAGPERPDGAGEEGGSAAEPQKRLSS